MAGAALLALALGAGPAASAPADEEGSVVRVVDGDTVEVDVAGDGTSRPVAIRNSGIQAMERGECHADEATAVLRSASLGRHVHLTAKSSTAASLGRPIRYVDTTSPSGTEDTQLAVLRAGYALAFPMGTETARAASYHLAMEQAAARRIGLFDSDACGVGPAQSARLRVMAMYEGDGDETRNPNAEWVDVLNEGTSAVSLSGWTLRTAAQDWFTFPAGTVVQPRRVVRLRVGTGTRTATTFYWGYTAPHLPNLSATNRVGGGAYLFDPDGDLRAHTSYPCVYGRCLTPATRGKVRITVNYDAPGDDLRNPNGEYLTITSLSTAPQNLSWAVIQVGGNTLQLGDGSVLPRKGSTIRVQVGKGTTTATRKYWGRTSGILTNTGGTAELRTAESVRIACAAWRAGRC